MSNIQAFDPGSFKQRVQEHIVSSFGSLIPEEQFAALIDAEVKAFFETEKELTFTKTSNGYYDNTHVLRTPMTPFRQMVWEKTHALMKPRIEQHFDGDFKVAFQKTIDSWFELPEVKQGELLKGQELLLTMAAQVFGNMLSTAGYTPVNDLRSKLINAFLNQGMPGVANNL